MYRTHAAQGALAWACVGPLVTTHPGEFVAGLATAAVCALGPDLDHAQSKASRALFGPLRGFLAGRIAAVLGGHRYGAHSLLSVAAVFVAALVLGRYLDAAWLAAAAPLGWAAHIVGDMATKQGVGVLWPLSRRRYRYAFLTTGGWGERVVYVATYLTMIYVAYLWFGDAATERIPTW